MTSKAVIQTDFYVKDVTANQAAKQQKDVKSNFGQMMNQFTSQQGAKTSRSAQPQKSVEKVQVERNAEHSKVKQNDTLKKTSRQTTTDSSKSVEEKAKELTKSIAEELGVSEEDVEKAMAALGMQAVDLLQPNALCNLLMEISGETDALALITNADLYASLQTLEQMAGAIRNGLEEALSLTPEELQQMMKALTEGTKASEQTEQSTSDSNMVSNPMGTMEEQAAAEDGTDKMVELSEGEELLTGKSELVDNKEKTEEVKQEKLPLENSAGNKKDTELIGKNTDGEPTEQEILVKPLQTGTEQNASNQSMTQDHSTMKSEESLKSDSKQGKNEAVPEFLQMYSNQISEKLDAALQHTKLSMETQDTERIMRQVMNQMKVHIGGAITEMEMQLHPASLGTVNLQVAFKDGALTAQFTAQNETVKAAIESQIVQLKENLNEQGIKVEAIEVTIASHEFERNLSKGKDGQQEETASGKQGRRKLNLDAMDSLEETQLEEAERIAVQLMKESGSTVDFTA